MNEVKKTKIGGFKFCNALALASVCLFSQFSLDASAEESLVSTLVKETMLSTNQAKTTVKGVVKDENGDPIPGASVMLKGTKTGTITDIDGRFSLAYSPDKKAELLVSFVGMGTQTVSINGKSTVNVRLTTEASALDEVVVTGYGTSKRKDLTGSVSRVGQAELKAAPMTNNIQGMLQGRAAGVNVMISSASPTSPVSVVIRGVSSLSGDGQPLWIIDGVPQYTDTTSGDVSNTLYNLNLNDVESLDVLKDASATAIYGSRAANGVVIVTTKSGAEGMKPTVEFSGRVGWQFINSNKFRSMNADEYKTLAKQAILDELYRRGDYSVGLTYHYMDEDKFRQINTSEWTKADVSNMWLSNAFGEGNENYWDLMTQNAMTQDYNVSLRGGSKSNSYYASFNYKDQEGIVKGSDTQYFGARFNFEGTIREKLKLGFNMDASAREANMKDNMIDRIMGMRSDFPAYDKDGNINMISFQIKNPLFELQDVNKQAARNFNGSLFLEYNILPFLKFRTTGNIVYSNVKSVQHNRAFYSDDINSGSQKNTQSYTMVWDNLLTFYKTIGKHDVQALLGHSVERNWNEFLYAAGSNFPDDDILNDLGSAAVKDKISSGDAANSLVSVFARLQYKYNERYLLTATMRTDGSSRFGKDSRWGYFPSGALAWIMTEEDFMKNIKPYVSYLKLRASVGLTGSQNLGNYDFVTLMGSGTYNGKPGIVQSSIGNDLLQWESQRQTDIGLDYGFWDDRIRGSLGWYRKYVDNLLYDRPIPTSANYSYKTWGVGSITQNIGAISNTGIEFDIRADIIKKNDLTLEVNFNIAHNKGKIEKLNGIDKYLGGGASDFFKLEEGGELGTFYGYVDAGRFYANAEEIYGLGSTSATNGKVLPYRSAYTQAVGDIYVMDLDGDGKLTADGDRKILGSSNPKAFGGFGTTLYWKGLMANLTFTYSVGGKRFWQAEKSNMRPNLNNAPSFILDSYTMRGEGATYPNISLMSAGDNDVFTDRWLHNSSYMRLSAINISYRLPQKWFKKSLVQGIEANLQATNLFTITPYPGMDPQGNFDSNSGDLAMYGYGYDFSSYPAARTFNVGLKFTFK